MIGPGARILEPWFVEVGENVTIGEEAKILGHRGEGREIVLGRVYIGDGAIIGLRSTVLPNLNVGTGAVVAACARVVSGTRIPDGEIWGGVPARKIGIAKTASNSSRKQQLLVDERV
jgi:acetyltransferase-like isoleucine patch superfamily enzyme